MFAMSFEKSLKSHVDALHVLREHTDIVASYLTDNQQTKNRNRRLAVLRNIRDLQKTRHQVGPRRRHLSAQCPLIAS